MGIENYSKDYYSFGSLDKYNGDTDFWDKLSDAKIEKPQVEQKVKEK